MNFSEKRIQGAALFLFAAFIAISAAYPHLHRPGHYGVIEFGSELFELALSLALIALTAAAGLVAWCAIANSKQELSLKYFIPAVLVLAAITFYFGAGVLHKAMFSIWAGSPFGVTFEDTEAIYEKRCMTWVQDDETSSHYEDDWHSGSWVCRPLERRLNNLYPRPDWLFGL